MIERRNRKATLYGLCAELAGCGLTQDHIATLLGVSRSYVGTMLLELGIRRHARDRDADAALARVPTEVRARVTAFRIVKLTEKEQPELA